MLTRKKKKKKKKSWSMVFMLPGTKSLLRNITRKMSHSEVSVTEWLGNDGVCAESEIAKQSIDGVGQSVFSKPWRSAHNAKKKNHLHLFCLQRQSDIFCLLPSTY